MPTVLRHRRRAPGLHPQGERLRRPAPSKEARALKHRRPHSPRFTAGEMRHRAAEEVTSVLRPEPRPPGLLQTRGRACRWPRQCGRPEHRSARGVRPAGLREGCSVWGAMAAAESSAGSGCRLFTSEVSCEHQLFVSSDSLFVVTLSVKAEGMLSLQVCFCREMIEILHLPRLVVVALVSVTWGCRVGIQRQVTLL